MKQHRWQIASAIFIPAIIFGICSLAPAAEQKPNIIIIMADDMGFSDIGCYGGEIETPNIDRLAADGLRFKQFYNTSRCCPTRASLLTGLYSHQAGVGDMVKDEGLPAYRGFLNDKCVTIGEVMRTAGYRTYLSGKWHVGEAPGHWPVDRGFDKSYSLVSGGTNYWRLDPGRTLAIDDKSIQPPADWYVTDAITDNAVKFIADAKTHGKPFFMYVPYTAPHWPLHAPADVIAKYASRYVDGWTPLRKERFERMKKMGIIDADWPLSPSDGEVKEWASLSDEKKKDYAHRMAVYAAQIDRMDAGIGKIVQQLADTGVKENTLIMFLADNGGCHEVIDRGKPGVPAGGADSFLSYGREWANVSNTPFRMYKHWVHEGGISSPLVVHWPGKVFEKGAWTNEPGHLIDLMATCIDVGGAKYPAEFNGQAITPLEGKSLAPIFTTGKREPHAAIYWEHEGNKAIRKGDWKLVAKVGGPWELYNLSADRSEVNNLAMAEPQRAKEMQTQWEAWAKSVGVKERKPPLKKPGQTAKDAKDAKKGQ